MGESKCVWQRCHNEIVVELEIGGKMQPHCLNHLISRVRMISDQYAKVTSVPTKVRQKVWSKQPEPSSQVEI